MDHEPAHAPETTSLLESIGAVFDHTAHAVPFIRPALRLYRDLLGGELVGGGFNTAAGHLAVQFRFPGGSMVELLEPLRPDSQSVSGFLARNPRGGLHHLTFKVTDLEAVLPVVTAAGYEPFATILDQPSWKETFLHPRRTGGVLIQLAQAGPGIPPALDRPLDEILDEAEAMRSQHR